MKDKIIGAISIAAIILSLWAASRVGIFSNGESSLGAATAAGNLLAENYIPYVLYNGGYSSAKDIATTGNVNGAIGTFSSTLSAAATTLSGTLTVTTTNAATSTTSVGCIQTTATSTVTPIKLTFGNGLGLGSNATTTFGSNGTVGLVAWTYGSCPNL